jgi:hypothetical protein
MQITAEQDFALHSKNNGDTNSGNVNNDNHSIQIPEKRNPASPIFTINFLLRIIVCALLGQTSNL